MASSSGVPPVMSTGLTLTGGLRVSKKCRTSTLATRHAVSVRDRAAATEIRQGRAHLPFEAARCMAVRLRPAHAPPAGSGRLRFQPTCGSCPDRRPLRPVRGPAASVRAGQCRANAQHTATVERYTDALFNRGAKDLTHRQRRVHADDLAAAVSDELLHTRLVVPHSILVPPHAMSAPKIRGRASSAATCQPSASREGG
eukprot:2918187-Rhodomonas_salina.1